MTLLHDTDVDTDDAEEHGARRPGRTRRTSADRTTRTTRSAAAQRAIDRRAKRREREVRTARVAERSAAKVSGRTRRAVSLRARITSVPFVVPVIGLLVVGLGLSLWLSTKAAADSYRLGEERQQNQALLDKRDSLKRTYESSDSAPELSDKAARLGMIPARNPARMIVDGPGKPRVVGDPEPAQGKALRSINPPTEPDPVATIDPKKVDDSQGLPGTAVESDETTEPDGGDASGDSTDSEQSQSDSPDDSAAGATSTPAPEAGSDVPASPGTVAPAPNVLPPNGNAPSANSAESR
ncbi:hypothetical protein GIY30_07075 [Gordonia sp. HNM0687]|uniref:Cell division protein FtsL n=1 Tax=Gordonia mangrovi TaxID=2665643 RepID=A0A6L7GMG5_9ACTN|nr:hypothetical protein [Gordonia mangrovi]MXP21114.1 hypothetical protein [Gordonia mangrovi]UVF78348.1 hypothetical protein NWF22_00155 [Gordonia mangrovi]